jgi:hypothetical protein
MVKAGRPWIQILVRMGATDTSARPEVVEVELYSRARTPVPTREVRVVTARPARSPEPPLITPVAGQGLLAPARLNPYREATEAVEIQLQPLLAMEVLAHPTLAVEVGLAPDVVATPALVVRVW